MRLSGLPPARVRLNTAHTVADLKALVEQKLSEAGEAFVVGEVVEPPPAAAPEPPPAGELPRLADEPQPFTRSGGLPD